MTDGAITRPVLRYHGGKWRLAPWIIQHLPPHRIYVEPFGGAASVLMRKPRSFAEVYNDLAGDVVNVFRVLREPETAARLCALLELTPFAREEFERAYDDTDDVVERARRTIARSFMGFGSGATLDVRAHGMRTRASTHWVPPTGMRVNSNRSHTTPAHDWRNYPEQIVRFVDRLRGVVVESRPALEVIAQHDRAEALFYVDPPYVHSTRAPAKRAGNTHAYQHELTDAEHAALLTALGAVQGLVVLSAYAHPMYDDTLGVNGWQRLERAAMADGSKPRTEVLWLCPRTVALQHDLFPWGLR